MAEIPEEGDVLPLSLLNDAERGCDGTFALGFATSRFQFALPAVLFSVLLHTIRTPPVDAASR